MPTATYSEKLENPQWKSVRRAVLKSLGSKCQECGTRKRLEIHKCAYVPRAEPWEQPQSLMMVLCRTCHQERQDFEDEIRIVVGRITRTMNKNGVENMFWRLAKESALLERMKSNEGNL